MLKVLFDEKQAPQSCPTQHFLMSWPDLFSAPPKAKTTRAWRDLLLLSPGAAHSPLPQEAELWSPGRQGEAANSSQFPGVRVPPPADLLWHVLEQQLSCLARAGVWGVFVFAPGFLAGQDKCT